MKLFLRNILMIISAMSITFFATFAASENQKAETVKKVAIVNKVVIQQTDLDREMKQVEKQFASQGKQVSKEELAKFKDRVLEDLIVEELIFQESRNKGIKIERKEVSDSLSDVKKRFPSDNEYNATLKEMQMTEAELTKKIKRGLSNKKLIDTQIIDKISIPEKDNKAFYDTHPEYFKKGEQVQASHILIKFDPKADEKAKSAAKKVITDIQAKLKKGEDFAVLAKANSTCPSSAKGGDLGFFDRGKMVKPFEEVAFKLKPGETSGIVETQYGYHIIKITDKKPESVVKFKDVKNDIIKFLKNEQSKKEIQKYIENLKTKATIERLVSAQ